jgi:hypothetical protein
MDDIISIILDKFNSNSQQQLYNYKIKVNYEYNLNDMGEKLFKRALLTSDRYTDQDSSFYNICNGLVLGHEDNKWRVLAIPPRTLNHEFNKKVIEKNLDLYDIYKTYNGTIITLYYYDNKWCISTSNGFDVSELCWMGPKSYMDILLELMELYPDFNLELLQPHFSYTIGFSHPQFHLLEDKKLWLVHVKSLNSYETIEMDIGLPVQELVFSGGKMVNNVVDDSLDKVANDLLDKVANKSSDGSLGEIVNNSSGNFSDKVANSSLDEIINTHIPNCYGLILRSKDISQTKKYSDIIIKSDFMRLMEKHVYNVNINIKDESRLDLIIVYNILDRIKRRKKFKELFPQFLDKIKEYEKFFDKLVNQVIYIYRQYKSDCKCIIAGKPNIVKKIIIDFVQELLKKYNINPYGKDSYSIISDFILVPENSVKLYDAYCYYTDNNLGGKKDNSDEQEEIDNVESKQEDAEDNSDEQEEIDNVESKQEDAEDNFDEQEEIDNVESKQKDTEDRSNNQEEIYKVKSNKKKVILMI